MTHLDDGPLRALMDDELSDTDLEATRLHLADCESCQLRLAELEGRRELVAQALGHLDTAAPTARARTAALERIRSSALGGRVSPTEQIATAEHPGPQNRTRVFRTPLARAAILVLVLGAGVVTALPASPVQGWIAAGWARAVDLFDAPDNAGTPVGPPGEAALPTPDGGDGAQDGTLAGVRLNATGEGISIVLRGIGSGSLIVVRLVPGGEAGAFADDPATFGTAEGRIEVIGAADLVFVDLPLEAASASIEVNGGIYVRRVGERIEVTGPIVARTTEEIHLRVP